MTTDVAHSVETMVETPAWVHDAIFYQIFPDRFAGSPSVAKPSNLEAWDSPPTITGFKGGDLVGIAEHLDHLANLGVSALYLNPIFRSTANHRYHTHDYFAVDPILGGNAAFDTLLTESHRRDIRIILDGVFNHVGRGFYQFSHLLENGSDSPYLDWFHVDSWPLHPYGPADQPAGYEGWWNNRELPKLAHETGSVRDFIFEVAEYWIRRGIDGWRLDVPNEIDDDAFWREFRRRIKAINPDAYIVGEIWTDARRWLAGDQFDGVQNYLFTKACLGFLAASSMDWSCIEGNGLEPVQTLDAAGFRSALDGLIGLYPWPVTLAQLNQLDSHDTARFINIAGGDESAFRLATLLQMTFPGAPCIYYGNETGIHGGQDPDCRRSFPWERSLWDMDRFDFVKSCIDLRRSNAVFRQGSFVSLYAQDDVYAFARMLEQNVAVVVINAATESRTIENLSVPDASLDTVTVAFGASAPRIEEGIIAHWEIDARSSTVAVGHART